MENKETLFVEYKPLSDLAERIHDKFTEDEVARLKQLKTLAPSIEETFANDEYNKFIEEADEYADDVLKSLAKKYGSYKLEIALTKDKQLKIIFTADNQPKSVYNSFEELTLE